MSDDINTSMQRERLAGAAAKSEPSDALHGYKQKYLDAINASPWIREHAAILPNEKESLYQYVRDACGGVFVYIPVDAVQKLEAQLAAAKAKIESLKCDVDMKMRDAMNANELAAKALAENAELRKRPTMEEFSAWLMQMDYGDFPTAFTTVRKTLINPANGLAAFIEQRRKKV